MKRSDFASERSVVLIKTGDEKTDIQHARNTWKIDCLIERRKDNQSLQEWTDAIANRIQDNMQYKSLPLAISMSGWSNDNINRMANMLGMKLGIDTYIVNMVNPDAHHYRDILGFRPSIPLMYQDRKGPFDIVGDIHGCIEEFQILLRECGYMIHEDDNGTWFSHPENRILVSVGDLCDKGPDSLSVMEMIFNSIEKQTAIAIRGNHENKVLRHLISGMPPDERSNAFPTFHEVMAQGPEYVDFIIRHLQALPTHYLLDEGKIVVSHGAFHPNGLGLENNKRINEFFMFGPLSDKLDEYGNIERLDWMTNYDGDQIVFYGHTPCLDNPRVIGKTICLDGGAFGGGNLMAMRYPEFDLVKVKALNAYEEYPYFSHQGAEKEFDKEKFFSDNGINPELNEQGASNEKRLGM